MSELRAVDLFCGAGGFSTGLEAAGFDIVYAIDSNEDVRETYEENHGLEMDCRPVEDTDPATISREYDNIDLVAGGPPCPTFSMVGRSKIDSIDGRSHMEDDRHQLYEYFLDFVEAIEPPAFVMENVEGMTSATNAAGRNVVEVIKSEMEDLGYRVRPQVVDAVNFGVPQHRERLFFIGNRMSKPNPDLADWRTHRRPDDDREQEMSLRTEASAYGEQEQTSLSKFADTEDEEDKTESQQQKSSSLQPWVTVADAIFDLPPVSPGGDQPPAQAETYEIPPLTPYQEWARNRSDVEDWSEVSLNNHEGRSHNMLDLSIYKLLGEGVGWNIGEARGNLDSLHPYRDDVFPDKYKKQHPTEPASTVIAHIQKDGHMYIHPREARSLTVREAARLQSFRDTYRFYGPRTSTFKQVGNAVPPLLARAIGDAIRETFFQHK